MEKYFNAIISEMQVLLDGQKLVREGDIFKNDQNAVKIEYNEATKQFELLLATVTDGAVSDFSVISSWLFDETQNEKDALAVGVDFADTLRGKLGLKKERGTVAAQLPVAEKNDSATILALTQKLLAVFPQYKDAYKASVEKYGKFLYLDFYTENFVPAAAALIDSGNKKQIQKLFDMLAEMYVSGNSETVDAIVAIICAVQFQNESRAATVAEQLADNTHLKTAVREFSAALSKNKKLQAALIK